MIDRERVSESRKYKGYNGNKENIRVGKQFISEKQDRNVVGDVEVVEKSWRDGNSAMWR